MIPITILKPTWKEARASKVFELDAVSQKPVLKEGYKLGKFFRFSYTSVDNIKGFYNLLNRCADSSVIRIAGKPVGGLKGEVQRLKDNFEDAGTNLLLIDCDDWPVPEGYVLRTPEKIHEAVKEILVNKMGIKPLADVACCILLSSSFWNYSRLRAHVYFEISDAVPISMLHDWATEYNKTGPTYALDPSMFLQVQPDFISRRICEGFSDPLPNNLRLSLHCDNLAPIVDKAALEGYFKTFLKNDYRVVDNQLQSSKTEKLSETWEETLKLCGTAQHGINEPAYRACAQLVQSVGNKVVQQNLSYYVEKVFSLVWQSIVEHKVRGDSKDKAYYDKSRFRNYIQTALEKQFGESTDARAGEVARALKEVMGGANPAILYDRDMIETYRIIRSKDPGKWASIRAIIKTKLKGVVNIADIDKALSAFNKTDIGSMMDQVFSKFTWIEGSIDQGLYCKRDIGKGYALTSLDSGVDSELYAMAISLFSDAVPSQFEKNLVKVLVSRSRDVNTTLFSKAVVENRCHTMLKDGKNVTYVNMGTVNGEMLTAVVTESGFEIVPSSQSPVVWSTDRQIQPMEIEYKRDLTIENKDRCINYYLKRMREFLSVEDSESLIDVIAWQIASLINTGTAHLLEITGASGDGKTVSALLTKELIDPTSSDIREGQDLHNGFYKKEDLSKILRSRHVTIVDNLSNLTPGIQDLLCSIATGWKFDLRIMYSQDFVRLIIKKPLILTALAPVITNQDLRSRSFSVSVSRRNKQQGGDIYKAWEDSKKIMRTGLLFLVSKVLEYVNYRRAQGQDLNDRDLWGTVARLVVMKHLGYQNGEEEKLLAMIKDRKESRDINEALLSSASSQVIAWVIGDNETFGVSENVMLTPTEMFTKFRNFINDKAGDEVCVGKVKIEITPRNIPTSARSFGILISKMRNDLQIITGFEIYSVRPGGVKYWKFSKSIMDFINGVKVNNKLVK